MKTQIVFLAILSLSLVCFSNCALRFAFKLVSEGAKSPQTTLDSDSQDLFGEEWDNVGTLTPVGYRMLYLLGTKDRQSYSSFLSSKFNPIEVFVRAGGFNSTLMSANAYLQGLFPPSTGPTLYPAQRVNAYPPVSSNYGDFNAISFGSAALPNLAQVFPVHSFDKTDRKYFFLEFTKCNHFWNNFEENYNEDNVKQWLEDFKTQYGEKLLRILNINDVDRFLEYEYVKEILLSFIADYTEGKTLQKFTDNGIDLSDFNTTATEFSTLDNYNVVSGYDTDAFYPNATMSGFRDEIKMWLTNRFEGDRNGTGYVTYQRPKLSIFVVPQATLAGIVAYMARDKGTTLKPLNYASSLSFELKLNDGVSISSSLTDADYTVDYYLDGGLLTSISYSEFMDVLDRAWDEETVRKKCSNDLIDRYGWKNATIVLAVLLGIFTLILIIMLIYCCKKPKSE